MTLDQEQDMTTLPLYSQLFACLFDQAEPIGGLGRGTHYSIFRSVQWREIDGDFCDCVRLHDFAIVWDEDHDVRVITILEKLHMMGLLWPIVFIGERKGTLTILLWQGVDPTKERSDWYEVVQDIVDAVEDDVWTVAYGTFDRDPANHKNQTIQGRMIDDENELVVAYLQSIDVLWQLGKKERAVHSPAILSGKNMMGSVR